MQTRHALGAALALPFLLAACGSSPQVTTPAGTASAQFELDRTP